MPENFHVFTAAAVQTAPVYMDKEATTNKVCDYIARAARQGAKLVAFPEAFIPGYPYWNWIVNPVEGSPWYEKLYKASVSVSSSEVEQICQCAAQYNIFVVIGVNEKGENSAGVIYNTLFTISDQGAIIGHHRKLVPTWAEKLTWTNGDAAGLVVHKTDTVGNLGVLACGENTNPLARFSLLAQGENVHVASYISLPVAPQDYDMAEAIKLRAAAHSFEGKVFTIVSCSTISDEIIAEMRSLRPDAESLLKRKNSAFSGVLGPDGRVIGDALIDEEGMVLVDIDLSKTIQPKQMHDIIGHYNRFDIFDVRMYRNRPNAMTVIDSKATRDRDNEGLDLDHQPPHEQLPENSRGNNEPKTRKHS